MANVSFIYVIRCKEYIKIGVSDKPHERLASLCTGNPFDLTIEALLFVLGSRQAYATEKKLHTLFSKHRIKGEWFDDSILDELLEIMVDPITCPSEIKLCSTAEAYDKKHRDAVIDKAYNAGFLVGSKKLEQSNPYKKIDYLKERKWLAGRTSGKHEANKYKRK